MERQQHNLGRNMQPDTRSRCRVGRHRQPDTRKRCSVGRIKNRQPDTRKRASRIRIRQPDTRKKCHSSCRGKFPPRKPKRHVGRITNTKPDTRGAARFRQLAAPALPGYPLVQASAVPAGPSEDDFADDDVPEAMVPPYMVMLRLFKRSCDQPLGPFHLYVEDNPDGGAPNWGISCTWWDIYLPAKVRKPWEVMVQEIEYFFDSVDEYMQERMDSQYERLFKLLEPYPHRGPGDIDPRAVIEKFVSDLRDSVQKNGAFAAFHALPVQIRDEVLQVSITEVAAFVSFTSTGGGSIADWNAEDDVGKCRWVPEDVDEFLDSACIAYDHVNISVFRETGAHE